jgi:hypothetical protein
VTRNSLASNIVGPLGDEPLSRRAAKRHHGSDPYELIVHQPLPGSTFYHGMVELSRCTRGAMSASLLIGRGGVIKVAYGLRRSTTRCS